MITAEADSTLNDLPLPAATKPRDLLELIVDY